MLNKCVLSSVLLTVFKQVKYAEVQQLFMFTKRLYGLVDVFLLESFIDAAAGAWCVNCFFVSCLINSVFAHFPVCLTQYSPLGVSILQKNLYHYSGLKSQIWLNASLWRITHHFGKYQCLYQEDSKSQTYTNAGVMQRL